MYEKEILKIYRKCNVKSFPIDCYQIVQGLGFSVKTYGEIAKNKDEFRMLLSFSQDAFTYLNRKLIVYNERAYYRRIRFSLMHEIGHIVLKTKDEDAADSFAAHILAPHPIRQYENLSNADEISRYFDISISAANRCMTKLDEWSEEYSRELVFYYRYAKMELEGKFSKAAIARFKRMEKAAHKRAVEAHNRLLEFERDMKPSTGYHLMMLQHHEQDILEIQRLGRDY